MNETIRTSLGHGSRRFCERHGTRQEVGWSSCLSFLKPVAEVSLAVGSAAAGRAARAVLFVFVVVNALRIVARFGVGLLLCILRILTV